MALDILIKNGWVIDGLNSPMFRADVGVFDGRIEKIGIIKPTSSRVVIDAENHLVTPGFIDINNSSDRYLTLLSRPGMESFIYQGVTTIIGGNCGSSLAPLVRGSTISSVQKWADLSDINVDWTSLKEFLDLLLRRKLVLNFGTLIGHSTLRRGLVGDQFRALDEAEINTLGGLLKKALSEGGLGISFGLNYSHAKAASKLEIQTLANIASSAKKIIAIHLRDEKNNLVLAVQEAIEIAEEARASLEISHFKSQGKDSQIEFSRALNLVQKAASGGLDINFDIYPYTFTATVLYTLLPDWAAYGGRKKLIENLRKRDLRVKAEEEMKFEYANLNDLIIASGHLDKTFIGKTLGIIASNQGLSVYQVIMDLLVAAEGRVIVFWPSINEADIDLALRNSLSIISSDGPASREVDFKSGFLVHPRAFGTFPRILGRFVRDRKVVGWEEAISKMTALPALKLGLEGRGVLKKGYRADITVFDPQGIEDKGSFTNPYQYAKGIKAVMVNGKAVLLDGKILPVFPGQIIV